MNETFVDQLLEQAAHLAQRDLRKPTQANLRRAVSAAYYAFFHFLILRSVQQQTGSVPSPAGIHPLLARTYDHGEMKECCKAFLTGSIPGGVQRFCGGLPRSPLIARLCADFVTAQEKRHEADYDFSLVFNRKDTHSLIAQVTSAIHSTRSAPMTDEFKLFLLCLSHWNKLKKRA